jgi:hypothetical protein
MHADQLPVDRCNRLRAAEIEGLPARPIADEDGPTRYLRGTLPFTGGSMLARRPGRGREQQIAPGGGRLGHQAFGVKVGTDEQAELAYALQR